MDENDTPINDVPVYVKGPSATMSISNEDGVVFFDLNPAKYQIVVSYIGYEPYSCEVDITSANVNHTIILVRKVEKLAEVRVIASEGKRLSATSTISREAMQHLQPTSLADVMELIPGALSKDPNMGQSAAMSMRETGPKGANGSESEGDGYHTHALGTLFVVDGVSLANNANMQYSQPNMMIGENASTSAREAVDIGVDMRQVSTDDIELVEVQRGIPSAEYGNLTSGVVNVKKIRRPTPLNARLKTDGKSTLVSLGKGVSLSDSHILNADASLLVSQVDPRNECENYKRITSSVRLTSKHSSSDYSWQFTPSLDIANNIDRKKRDPQANIKGVEEYKTRYTRVAASSGFLLSSIDAQRVFRKLSVNLSSSLEWDRLMHYRTVTIPTISITPVSSAPGEQDAKFLLSSYDASYLVDGKPFNASAKASSEWLVNIASMRNEVKAGAEWSIAKNWGDGQVFDIAAPPSLMEWRARPRRYSDIPAVNSLGMFVQDYVTANVGHSELVFRLGLRSSSLLGLNRKYVMSGRLYLDPRINIQWSLPATNASYSLSLGYGRTSLMPTMKYLYPDPYFVDISELVYYSQKIPHEYNIAHIRTYKEDVTNYAIHPAQNKKWEARVDVESEWGRLWVTYFEERMSDGFRTSKSFKAFAYNKYDAKVIDGSSLTSKPVLSDIPYSQEKTLRDLTMTTNGSRQNKFGVEFEYISPRINAIKSSFVFNGAWFRSVYENSQPFYEAPSTVLAGVNLKEKYVGMYRSRGGRENEQCNLSLLCDTQLPMYGLIFSTTVQSTLFVKTRLIDEDNYPIAYYSVDDDSLHPYIRGESDKNPLLKPLESVFGTYKVQPYTIPIAVYVNFKVSKKFRSFATISMFANRMIDYTPSYEILGSTVYRNTSPYFGMECSIRL